MSQVSFESHDSVLFLAMCCAGGGPFTLMDLIWVYDWINRDVLGAKEMEGALNRLMAAKLIKVSKASFSVPKDVFDEFQAYLRKRRKHRFDVAKAFLKEREPLSSIKRRIEIAATDYRTAYKNYSKAFEQAYKATEKSPSEKKKKNKVSAATFYAGKKLAESDWYLCVTIFPKLSWARRRRFDDGSSDACLKDGGTLFGFDDADSADQFLQMNEFVSIPELIEKVTEIEGIVFSKLKPPSWKRTKEKVKFEYKGK